MRQAIKIKKLHPIPFYSLFFCLSLLSCQPEPRNAIPADDTYIYSGTFRAIQDHFILVDDERPIFAASKMNSRGLFKEENCEAGGRRVDDFGNEEVRVLFNEDFWMSDRFRRMKV